jgi:hypothetical protein
LAARLTDEQKNLAADAAAHRRRRLRAEDPRRCIAASYGGNCRCENIGTVGMTAGLICRKHWRQFRERLFSGSPLLDFRGVYLSEKGENDE